MSRILVVNADDFGLTAGINAGVARCHEQGILTSASLMVRGPAAAAAAAYARARPGLSVGLHIDLCEWACRGDEWYCVYDVVGSEEPAAVAREVRCQLDAFCELMGRPPTHLDSHQHVHRAEPLRSVAVAEARALGVPLRDIDPPGRYCGAFYGQSAKGYPYPEGIAVDTLVRVLTGLPEGWTELGCHPAAAADVESVYNAERVVECATLCDPRVREAIVRAGIRLARMGETA